jgi:hypothetical protein
MSRGSLTESQNYHNFNLWRNYKIWVTERFLMIKLSLKDTSNKYLDSFKDIYRKISQLRNLEKGYGSLIISLNLNINPNPTIARERIYQDYIHEYQMLLVEIPKLAEKLAVYFIQKDYYWFPADVNIDVSEVYDKCFKENLTLTKNCILRKSLAYFPMTSRVIINSNHMDTMRFGISTKGQVISIGNSIDFLNFKEIGTKITGSITI